MICSISFCHFCFSFLLFYIIVRCALNQVAKLVEFFLIESKVWLCPRMHSRTGQLHCKVASNKGQTKLKWFFQADVSSEKRTNEFNFTTMTPQVDLFSFVFWKKLKTPKRYFEIKWPLETSVNAKIDIFYLICPWKTKQKIHSKVK